MVGLRARSNRPSLDGLNQPMILQPEIGILGSLFRRTPGGPQILLQAKTEPGNVSGTQLAPSVQATVSNYTRRHGGKPTPHLEHFLSPTSESVADCVQSEQGTRFIDKFNRNSSIFLESDRDEPTASNWSWSGIEDVLSLLRSDFVLNTDLRSVLTSCDWEALCRNGAPFSRWSGSGTFGEKLLQSYRASEDRSRSLDSELYAQLEELRRSIRIEAERVPLRDLAGWRVTEGGISSDHATFDVRLMSVSVGDREVERWDQPLLASSQEDDIILYCQMHNDVLHFLFAASPEIGFRDGVQLGPSVQSGNPGIDSAALNEIAADNDQYSTVAAVKQSDEGGRFYRSVAQYRIIELPQSVKVPSSSDLVWATLRQCDQMLKKPGILTNEARSALSLLLPEL